MRNKEKMHTVICDINEFEPDVPFDCIWASHILEHQLNSHNFLLKLNSILKEGGVLAITVPPYKSMIVGGHVSLWNVGLLLYNLVLAGFDCSNASAKTYGYNVSVIVSKKSINIKNKLHYDCGDIREIKEYLPKNLKFSSNELDDPFEGNIDSINWD